MKWIPGALFLDTDGLFTAIDAGDSRRNKAQDLLRANRRKVVHSVILSELVALGTSRKLRKSAITLVFELLENPEVETIFVDEETVREALGLLHHTYTDKAWSLCDIISFVLMWRGGIHEALTSDEDFRQAGFKCLL